MIQDQENTEQEIEIERQETKGKNSGQKTKLICVTKTLQVGQGQEKRKLGNMYLSSH